MRRNQVLLLYLVLSLLFSIVFAGCFRHLKVKWATLGRKIHQALEGRYKPLSIFFKTTCPVYPRFPPKKKQQGLETFLFSKDEIQDPYQEIKEAREVYDRALQAMTNGVIQDSTEESHSDKAKSNAVQGSLNKVINARSKYHLAVLYFARQLLAVSKLPGASRRAHTSVDNFLSTIAHQLLRVEAPQHCKMSFSNNKIQRVLGLGGDIMRRTAQSAVSEHHRIIKSLCKEGGGNAVDDDAFLKALKVIANDASDTFAAMRGKGRATERKSPALTETGGCSEVLANDAYNDEQKSKNKAINLWSELRSGAKDFKQYLVDGEWDANLVAVWESMNDSAKRLKERLRLAIAIEKSTRWKNFGVETKKLIQQVQLSLTQMEKDLAHEKRVFLDGVKDATTESHSKKVEGELTSGLPRLIPEDLRPLAEDAMEGAQEYVKAVREGLRIVDGVYESIFIDSAFSGAVASAKTVVSTAWKNTFAVVGWFHRFFVHPTVVGIILAIILLIYLELRFDTLGRLIHMRNYYFNRRRADKEFFMVRQRRTRSERIPGRNNTTPLRRVSYKKRHEESERGDCSQIPYKSEKDISHRDEKMLGSGEHRGLLISKSGTCSESSQRRARKLKKNSVREKQLTRSVEVANTDTETTTDPEDVLLPNASGPITRSLSKRLLKEESSSSTTTSGCAVGELEFKTPRLRR